jgi:hypothetical protein
MHNNDDDDDDNNNNNNNMGFLFVLPELQTGIA